MTTQPELPIPAPNGFDSMIVARDAAWAAFLPEGIQVEILGRHGAVVDWSMASEADVPKKMPPQDVLRASLVLRRLVREAVKIGSTPDVQHAWFIITTDRDLVEKYGVIHPCVGCRASTDQALAALREHPHRPLIVGILAF